MVRDYELMFIVRPELDDEGVQAAIDSVTKVVESNDGQVVKTTLWGKRRLAYEVKRLREGHYVIAKLRLEGSKVTEIERTLRIHDTIFRHLLVVDEAGPEAAEEAPVAVEAATPEVPATDSAAEAAVAPAESTNTDEVVAEAAESTPEPVAAGVEEEDN